MRVLAVEDWVRLAGQIRRGLRERALLADVAAKGEDALWMAVSSPYDVLTLDARLPGIDGFEVCRRLRDEDRIAGLDDYLVKPFHFDKLGARLRALARGAPVDREPVLRVGDIKLDPAARRVSREDREIPLSAKDFQLLEVFVRNPDQVLDRYQLLEGAWDNQYEHRSNITDVYVRSLREMLDRPFGAASFETVRGVGYRLGNG